MTLSVGGYPNSRPRYAQGWAISLAFHGFFVLLALSIVSTIHLPPSPETFMWDVAVHEPPPPQPVIPPSPVQPEVQQSVSKPPTPAEAKPIERQVVAQEQPTQVVQRTIQRQEVREVSQVEAVSQSVVQAERSPTQTTQAALQSSAAPVSTAGVVQQTVQAIAETGQMATSQKAVTREGTPHSTQREVVRESGGGAVSKGEILTASTGPAISHAIGQTSQAVATSAAVTQAAPQTVQRSAPQELVKHPTPSGDPPAAKEAVARSAPATSLDYGWLIDSLQESVSKLKVYPHMVNLRIVLQEEEGQMATIVHVKIETSSGYSMLDREALEIAQKIFPLKLKHPLGQSRKTVDLPISYRLNR